MLRPQQRDVAVDDDDGAAWAPAEASTRHTGRVARAALLSCSTVTASGRDLGEVSGQLVGSVPDHDDPAARVQRRRRRARTWPSRLRPSSGCSIFGSADFIRLPSPAARMITVRSSVTDPHPPRHSTPSVPAAIRTPHASHDRRKALITVGQYPPRVGISRRTLIIGSAMLGGGRRSRALGPARRRPTGTRPERGRHAARPVRHRRPRRPKPNRVGSAGLVLLLPPQTHGRVPDRLPAERRRRRALPVCLVLHGLRRRRPTCSTTSGYHRMLAGAVAAGVPPFVLAAVDGGDRYWHPAGQRRRPAGHAARRLPGGAGAARTAGGHSSPCSASPWAASARCWRATEAPERFVAVVASAPAFWLSFDEAQDANPGAFDSAERLARVG